MAGRSDLQSPINGIFWLQDQDDHLPGLLTLTSRWPRVELFGNITPPFITESPRTMIPATDGAEELVIHGRIEGGTFQGWSGRVSLIRAHTRQRRMQLAGAGPIRQVLESQYAVLGGHIFEPEARFSAARIRVQNIDDWVSLPVFNATMGMSDPRITVSYTPQKIPSTFLPGNIGLLSFHSTCSWTPPSSRGTAISTNTWLELRFDGGYTINSIRYQFVAPVSALMTILYGVDCPPVDLEVYDEDTQRWLKVFAYEIVTESEDNPPAPLMRLNELGCEQFANWIGVFRDLAPIPAILTGTIIDKSRAVENRLIELAMAAEGLHRRLNPDGRRISEEDVRRGLATLEKAPLPEEVRKVVSDALRIYLWDHSFPVRIADLANQVSSAAPNVCGKVNRWKRAITNARNGFAHSLPEETESSYEQILINNSLAESLRWLLTIRLLQETGAEDLAISNALVDHRDYRLFLSQAKEILPRIYG